MNYIDPTFTGLHTLKLNTRSSGAETIVWTITKEGDDDVTVTFSSDSANATLLSYSYYQELIIDLDSQGVELKNECWYVLKGVVGSSVVYRGRILSTNKDITSYSINENKYKENPNTNNYIILD